MEVEDIFGYDKPCRGGENARSEIQVDRVITEDCKAPYSDME